MDRRSKHLSSEERGVIFAEHSRGSSQNWPIYVAWWIKQCHQPTWPEACARLEHLHDHGPTVHAFTFKSAFDPQGVACKPNARLDLEQA
jgi:hypothetical protein